MINKDFFPALQDLAREKNISEKVFLEALETALVIAYKKHTGTAKAIEVKLVPERNIIRVIAYQTVVEEVEDRDNQISLEDARMINRKHKVGDIITEEVSSKEFGRIAAQTAKQVIMQKLREVESEHAFAELSEKEDQLITCVVRRVEGKNVYVEINKLEAMLSSKDLSPSDRFREGDKIKVYVKKIKVGTRGPQIIVTRSDAAFVRKLFEIEAPEIASGLVEIKAIAREAGYRTKMAVYSSDKSFDAVGACVGMRGTRVNAIVAELGGEKVDIVPWCPDVLEFIARSLSPARVVMVQVNDDDKTAKVIVLDDMISLAIGAGGLNARLANKLTGWKIDIKPYSSLVAGEATPEIEPESNGPAETLSVFEEELGELED